MTDISRKRTLKNFFNGGASGNEHEPTTLSLKNGTANKGKK